MKNINRIIGITLVLITLTFSQQIEAQKRDNAKRNTTQHRTNNQKRSVGTTHHRNDRYRTQPIHRNRNLHRSPHYRYPRHRRVVRSLHHNHLRLVYGGLTYFYYSGIYYTTYGNEYIVVVPPRGFRIAVLPVGHVRVIVGPSIYFYHSGTYYIESSSSKSEEKYEITQPPVGAIITDISNDAEQIIMDGNILYEYNDVFYKKVSTDSGNTTYKVVYSKNND